MGGVSHVTYQGHRPLLSGRGRSAARSGRAWGRGKSRSRRYHCACSVAQARRRLPGLRQAAHAQSRARQKAEVKKGWGLAGACSLGLQSPLLLFNAGPASAQVDPLGGQRCLPAFPAALTMEAQKVSASLWGAPLLGLAGQGLAALMWGPSCPHEQTRIFAKGSRGRAGANHTMAGVAARCNREGLLRCCCFCLPTRYAFDIRGCNSPAQGLHTPPAGTCTGSHACGGFLGFVPLAFRPWLRLATLAMGRGHLLPCMLAAGTVAGWSYAALHLAAQWAA